MTYEIFLSFQKPLHKKDYIKSSEVRRRKKSLGEKRGYHVNLLLDALSLEDYEDEKSLENCHVRMKKGNPSLKRMKGIVFFSMY